MSFWSPTADTAPSAQASRYHFSEDWVTENTTNWSRILRSFKGKTDVHALGVGSFEGRSALWFLENILTHPTDSITFVDIWVGPYENLFDDNVRAYPEPNKVINFTRYIIQCVLRLIGDYIMDAVDLQADDISLAPPFP